LKPFVTHDYCKDEGIYFLDKFLDKKRVPKRMSVDTISSFFGPSEQILASAVTDTDLNRSSVLVANSGSNIFWIATGQEDGLFEVSFTDAALLISCTTTSTS
jgi:hypothetical protein